MLTNWGVHFLPLLALCSLILGCAFSESDPVTSSEAASGAQLWQTTAACGRLSQMTCWIAPCSFPQPPQHSSHTSGGSWTAAVLPRRRLGLVAQWYPLPFFLVLVSLIKEKPTQKKGALIIRGLPRRQRATSGPGPVVQPPKARRVPANISPASRT